MKHLYLVHAFEGIYTGIKDCDTWDLFYGDLAAAKSYAKEQSKILMRQLYQNDFYDPDNSKSSYEQLNDIMEKNFRYELWELIPGAYKDQILANGLSQEEVIELYGGQKYENEEVL